jgi:EAL domain-containing protein (putative c-di-GMP-specific phosphodiesterase class I)/CheY-like chemotaxis protein
MQRLVAVPEMDGARDTLTMAEPADELPDDPPPIRILIADDDEAILTTLGRILSSESDLEVIGLVRDAQSAIRAVMRRTTDVALLDVRMPEGGGPRAAREIHRRSPSTRLIALSADGDDESVDEMLAGGAMSFLVKDESVDDIIEAIHRAVSGDATISQAVAKHVAVELGSRLDREHRGAEDRLQKEWRIRRVLDDADALAIAYQPIIEVGTGRIVGFEASSRFVIEPRRAPDRWFAEAAEVGLGPELQAIAVRRALIGLWKLPSDVFVSVNIDPETLGSASLIDVVNGFPGERIVVELTEHFPAGDHPSLLRALAPLRRSGVRLAIDDAGAGSSSLRHVLELAPDIIKLDSSISRHVDSDPSHRALAEAFVGFTRETGIELIAEGVQTAGAAQTLQSLGVRWIQGSYVASPGPLPHALSEQPGTGTTTSVDRQAIPGA